MTSEGMVFIFYRCACFATPPLISQTAVRTSVRSLSGEKWRRHFAHHFPHEISHGIKTAKFGFDFRHHSPL